VCDLQDQQLTTGAAFTVCVRLGAFEACPFLVSAKKYADATTSFEEGCIIRLSTMKVDHIAEDPATPGFRYVINHGVIENCIMCAHVTGFACGRQGLPIRWFRALGLVGS
jgi:hypothetical protein